MSATLVKSGPRGKTYSVTGDTLEEIWKSILKKGPRDPNDRKRVAFLTTTTLEFDPDRASYEGDGDIVVDRKSGWFEAKAKVRRMEVKFTSEILGPSRNVRSLSTAATLEWLRFYVCAIGHEYEHVEKALKESEKIVREINELRGTGLGPTEREAAEFAIDDLKTLIFEKYSGKMEKRLNAVHAKYDKSTKHGASQGAKLKLSVQ